MYIFQPRYSPFPFLLSNLVIDALLQPALICIIDAMKPFHPFIDHIIIVALSLAKDALVWRNGDRGEETMYDDDGMYG